MVCIGLVGDRDDDITAHRAIPIALRLAAERLSVELAFEWVATDAIDGPISLARFDGLWCVPGSPYRSERGALSAIRIAREEQRAFLGTCGGFQHAIVEYARNVLGWDDAAHAEAMPDAERAVIAPLACALVEVKDRILLHPGTRIAAAYGAAEITEGYRCRYGLNPRFQAQLLPGPLRAGAEDATGEVRAVELDGAYFFVATLFQPERAALDGRSASLVEAFVRAAADSRNM